MSAVALLTFIFKIYSFDIMKALVEYFARAVCPVYWIWLLLFAFHARAEPDSTSTNGNIHFVLSLDSRSTIIDQHHVRINGGLTGISFGEKYHKVTIGYYWLGYSASRRLINWHKKLSQSVNLSYYTKTDVWFVSTAYWYPIIRSNKWTLSVPIEVGVGTETANYRQLVNDTSIRDKNFRFEPYQIGAYGEYRMTPWAGLDAQFGYRNAISPGYFRRRFAGVYYSYGLTLYPGTIYKDLKGWYVKRH